MRTRKLGYSDLEITTIGLGTWAIGGPGWRFSWGEQDDRDSEETIRAAVDLGINWIDTAAVYGLGHSEEIVGKAIKTLHPKPYIATKCGRLARPDGALYGNLSRESIRKEVENSLKRLQVDCIDLYQIHWPDPDEQIEEGWSTLADLVKEGKIRYAGVSNFSLQQLKRIQPIHPVTSLQPPYSMLRRGIEGELLEYCAANQIGVIVYSPMGKGLLTQKFSRSWVNSLPEDDHRRRDPNFQEPRLSLNLNLVERLNEIAVKNNHTLAQLAIAWTLRNPAVTAAIVGARRPTQIQETASAGDWQLSPETIQEIELVLNEYSKQITSL